MYFFRKLQTSATTRYGDLQEATNFCGHKIWRSSGSYKVCGHKIWRSSGSYKVCGHKIRRSSWTYKLLRPQDTEIFMDLQTSAATRYGDHQGATKSAATRYGDLHGATKSGATRYGDLQGATNFRGHKLRRSSGSYKLPGP
jgi:hypothetical protein